MSNRGPSQPGRSGWQGGRVGGKGRESDRESYPGTVLQVADGWGPGVACLGTYASSQALQHFCPGGASPGPATRLMHRQFSRPGCRALHFGHTFAGGEFNFKINLNESIDLVF